MSIQINEKEEAEDKFTKLKNYIISFEEIQIKNRNEIIAKNEKEKSQLKSDIISLKTAIDIKDENISKSKEILSKYKENLSASESKVSNLENENQRLNHIIIELTQNNNNNKNISSDSFVFKIDELEILNKKLEFDNKRLEEKIIEISTKSQIDLNLYKLLKQSEINQKDKIIQSQKQIIEELQKNNIYTQIDKYQLTDISTNYDSFNTFLDQISDFENEIQNNTEEILNLKKANINLTNKIKELEIEIEHKNNMISSIQNITKDNIMDYQINLIEAQNNFNKNEEYLKMSNFEIQKLVEQRDDILHKNEQLIEYLNQFQDNIQITEQNYNSKIDEYSKSFEILQIKLNEYKNKIKLLKIRIDQLLDENSKLKKDIKIGINYVHNIEHNSDYQRFKNCKKCDNLFNDSKNTSFLKDISQKSVFYDIQKSLNDYKDFLNKVNPNNTNI